MSRSANCSQTHKLRSSSLEERFGQRKRVRTSSLKEISRVEMLKQRWMLVRDTMIFWLLFKAKISCRSSFRPQPQRIPGIPGPHQPPPNTSVWFFGRVGYQARLLNHVISQSEISTVCTPIKACRMPNELAERRPPMGSCSLSGSNEFTQLSLGPPHQLWSDCR